MTYDKIVDVVKSLRAHMSEEVWIKTAHAFSDALVDGTTNDFPGWCEHVGRDRFLAECGVPVNVIMDVDFSKLPKAVVVWPPGGQRSCT
jgi:hypothetical protein